LSYNYHVLNDRPRHFYPLVSGALAWNDATGGANGNVVGTPIEAPPLVVGGGNSYVMDGSNHYRFLTPLFYLDSPARPFTLEAWFKAVSITGPKGIIGHNGQDDGLQFDGESISFTTLHGPAGPAVARYYPENSDASFHAVGVHSESKNELFVDGTLVASIDLTEAQLLSNYTISTAPGYLYVGHRPGSIIVDAVAVYSNALTARQVKLHFTLGRDVPDLRELIQKRSGDYWTLTDNTSAVAFDFKFDTNEEWQDAQAASVRIADNLLLPAFAADGSTVSGTWIAGFILPSIIEPKVDGSKIEFDGDGNFQIHTSINDGTTWSPAVNGREVTGLSAGATTTNKALLVRVTFPAGTADNVSRLRHLSIKLYRNRSSAGSITGLPVSLIGKAALATSIHQPIENDDSMGVEFYDGGSATMPSLSGIRTLEFWVKANAAQPTTAEWWHILDYRNADSTGVGYLARDTATSNWSVNGGTLYVNGKATILSSDFALTPTRWYHVVFVMSAPSTNRIIINNNFVGDTGRPISVGLFATYPQVMTAADASSLYNAYMGIPNQVIVETTGLVVRDAPTQTVKIYSYDWSTLASG